MSNTPMTVEEAYQNFLRVQKEVRVACARHIEDFVHAGTRRLADKARERIKK